MRKNEFLGLDELDTVEGHARSGVPYVLLRSEACFAVIMEDGTVCMAQVARLLALCYR